MKNCLVTSDHKACRCLFPLHPFAVRVRGFLAVSDVVQPCTFHEQPVAATKCLFLDSGGYRFW